MTRFAVVALGLLTLAGCGGGGGKSVAEVGGQKVTQQQLDALVAHFRREYQLEGREFPAEGTRTFRQVRNQLLGLLVYRTELKQAADRLGIEVSSDEVSKRLAAAPGGGEEEGDANGDTFARDSTEAELLRERIAAKVARVVTGKTLAERSASRNAKLTAFLARLQRETKVRYEPGYSPGS
jgi:SurA-like protein